jgi:hypothetical protein
VENSEGDETDIIEPFSQVCPDWLCSRPLHFFLKDYAESIGAFYFVVGLAHRADRISETALKALIPGAPESERVELERRLADTGKVSRKLSDFSAYNSRSITSAVVDGFLTYISGSLQAVMLKHPRTLKSSEQIKVQDILEFSSFKDLTEFLVDRRINRLSYGGIGKIEEFISDTFGLELFTQRKDREQICYFIEVRNLHAHSRGRVNQLFLDRTSDLSKRRPGVGRRLVLDYDELVENCKIAVDSARDFDARLCKKFGIKTKRFRTWKRS